jgi:hypothetical protein
VDRIQKDILHSSIYSYLNEATTSFTTSPNVYAYTLSPTNIRRIRSVYDRTRERKLYPSSTFHEPVTAGEKEEPVPGQTPEMTIPMMGDASQQSGVPLFYRHIGAQGLTLSPTPLQGLVISIVYEQQIATVTDPTATLTVPDDAKDMMVAGVNYLASVFLRREQEMQFWLQLYERLKQGQGLAA